VTIKYGPISDENLADALKHHGAEDIDIHRMAEELRARRAADLTAAEREALRFAAMVVSASEFLFADRMTDPKIAAHVGRCRAALSALARVLGGGE
jgi:hypothetical protein